MQNDFYRLVSFMANSCFAHFNVSQKKNMSDLLTAFLSNTSIAMWDISTNLSGNTSTKHKNKRLIYFLDSLTIDTTFWKCFSLAVFSLPGFRFKKRKVITIALNATELNDDFWLLAATVSFNGRGIPIYLKSWEGVDESYNRWDRVKTVLKELKEILSKNCNFEIVASTDFQGSEMIELCKEIGIDFNQEIKADIDFGIEAGKSKLHWENYTEKVPQNDRLIKCVIISCLSYAVQTAIGNQMDISDSDVIKRTKILNTFKQTIRRGAEELKKYVFV